MTHDCIESSCDSTFPGRLFGMLTSYQTSAILKAAIELHVFTGFSGGSATAADLAGHCAVDTRAMRILCDGLTALGLLTKDIRGYSPVRDCLPFLDPRSPAYIGSSAEFLFDTELLARWSNLAANVRHGGALDYGTISTENP